MNLRLVSTAPSWLGILVFATCAVFSPACKSTRSSEPMTPLATPTEPSVRSPDIEPTPAWVGEALSWEKLKAIEAWLAAQPPDSHGFWRVEGELQLNQGRMELARKEQSGAKPGSSNAPNANAITSRVRAARAAFDRIAKDADATDGQKKRAQDLFARATRLLDGSKNAVFVDAPTSGMTVIPRSAWGAMSAHTERMEKTKGGYKRITVHHSAEEKAPDLDGSVSDSAQAIRQMQKSHMESKSPRWGDIGYHFLIDPAGHVFQGRELVWQGAHAEGDNNVQNIGICLIGNFDEDRPSKAALDSLRRLLDSLRRAWEIPKSAVYGHQDLKSTRCPGKYLEPWVKTYAH